MSLLTLFACASIQSTAQSILHATNDTSLVVTKNTLIFDVLENDNVDGELIQFYIKDEPEQGKITTKDDGFMVYHPNTNVCETIDSFTYVIANDLGESEATVFVEILCESLTFYSGFSSDLNQENDNSFVIKGVELYPNNTLSIFNSWGNEVYYVEGYQNNWTGDTEEGRLVQEMCYYVFEDGEGNTYSGYIQIN